MANVVARLRAAFKKLAAKLRGSRASSKEAEAASVCHPTADPAIGRPTLTGTTSVQAFEYVQPPQPESYLVRTR